MAWTEDQKKQAVEKYQEANPTPETSTEIIKKIAEELEQNPNGVRMILTQAGVYVKIAQAGASSTKAAAGDKPATKRVSKDDSIAALKAAIEKREQEVNDEVLDKLTGKAAVYFTELINKL